MKPSSKYNRSEIMQRAWSIYRSEKRYGMTFSLALKMSWKEAKKDIARQEWGKSNNRTWTNNYSYSHTGMNSLYANRAYSGD